MNIVIICVWFQSRYVINRIAGITIPDAIQPVQYSNLSYTNMADNRMKLTMFWDSQQKNKQKIFINILYRREYDTLISLYTCILSGLNWTKVILRL